MTFKVPQEGMNSKEASQTLKVLNVGAGARIPGKLNAAFQSKEWIETRLDIDPSVIPDVISSVTDLSYFDDDSFNAIWSSHNIEHLPSHDIPVSLREFVRVLKTGGFALITCPDLTQIAELLIKHGPDFVAYNSPAGAITPIDMLFGHRPSIASGNDYMTHRSGFTSEMIAHQLLDAGFSEVRVIQGTFYDLWALALIDNSSLSLASRYLHNTKLNSLVNDAPIDTKI